MKKFLPLFLCILITGCSNLLFHPEKEHIFTPARLNMPYEDLKIQTPDGIALNAWYIPAYCSEKTPCPSNGIILYLHGNAENISTHAFSVIWLVLHGYDLVALDYRGFGKSEGSVSLSGAETDIQTAIDYLLEKHPDKTLFVFGQSIGAALTVSAVAKYKHQDKIAGIIIDSAFAKARRIAREKIAQFWLLWLFQYPLSFLVPENNAEGNIARITIPKLFLTTEDDQIVPPHHTRELYAKAVQPKELEIIETGGHIRALNNEAGKNAFLNFLKKNNPSE
ncbi:MAG: alpha/beta fold hydrolase [Alphaproteobacteria bacterium]|nr:alpha/beta fold hydrolase [Alphaproteobacteria bacterium]